MKVLSRQLNTYTVRDLVTMKSKKFDISRLKEFIFRSENGQSDEKREEQAAQYAASIDRDEWPVDEIREHEVEVTQKTTMKFLVS